LCTEAAFAPLSDRLLAVVGLSLNDEAACRHARRKYVQLALNDFLMTPGPAPEPHANGAGLSGRDYGLMQPFFARWSRLLPARLASAAGEEVRVPPGNSELHEVLRRYEPPCHEAAAVR